MEVTNLEKDLRRLESVLHSARLGIWDWFITTGSVVFNMDWKTMVGYQPDELPNTISTWENLIHPDDKDRVQKSLDLHLARETEYYSCEHRLLHKNGHYIWILDTGKIVEFIDDKPYRATGIHQDITERKELEFNLKRALESKDMFMTSISHDINNLLNCISLPSQIIKLKDTTCKYKEQIEMILRSTDSLSSLLSDIMDYVKYGENQIKLCNQKTNLADLVNDTVLLLRPLSDEKGIKISICLDNIDPEHLYVNIDRQRFGRVISNLVSNSIKYGKKDGYVKIRLSVLKDAYFQMMVEDNGIGMSPKLKASLFTPFVRGEGHDNIKGYGLGMCIVDRIVKQMGGNIEVWSEQHLGTNIMITIPQGFNSSQHIPCGSTKVPDIACPPKETRPITILYGEDNDAHYKMLTEFLDYHFIRAKNGNELVELALSVPHDLIITDIMMPELNGDQAIRKLRNNGYVGPVLAVTGNVYKDDIMNYYAAGINKIISKPYSLEVLISTVNELYSLSCNPATPPPPLPIHSSPPPIMD